MTAIRKIGLGGGCHWCTEGVFKMLKGVVQVEQGWIASSGSQSSFSEAVIVHYDPSQVSLFSLIEVHLLTHASTSNHSMREKYRSAIYFFSPEEKPRLVEVINELQQQHEGTIITQLLPFKTFRGNEESYLNYYQKNKEAPFCRNYIDPKIQKLKKTHPEQLIESVFAGEQSKIKT